MKRVAHKGPIPFFSEEELACQGAGVIKLDWGFAVKLPILRNEWGRPLVCTSVCRTPEHNKAVGGHPNSLHLTDNPKHPTGGTMAADFYWGEWSTEGKLEFARLAYYMGWSVGLNDVFVHVDLRKDIGLEKAVFTYGSEWSEPFTKEEVTAQ